MEILKERIYYLDNLRSFALVLGPIFHVSIIYANEIGYVVKSDILSDLFFFICHLIHSFRMPLFFFLSGYFSELVLKKKGSSKFLKTRFEKLVIPTIFGIFCLASVEAYFLYIQKNSYLNFIEFYPKFFTKEFFTYSHIWFLVNLILYSTLFFGLRKINLFLFKPIQVIFLSFIILLSNIFINKNFTLLEIKILDFMYYLSFYFFGIISFKEDKFYSYKFLNSKFYSLFLFILLINYFYINKIDPYWIDFKYIYEYRIFHLFLESSLSWSIILFLLFQFQNKLNFDSKKLNYFRNSGITVYLVHHPISISLGYFFKNIDLSIYLKFLSQLILVYLISFFIYEVIRRLKNLFSYS